MSKYALAKIGQRIIFDRESSACDRSNTNGNVGTYLLFKLLAETNPEDEFFIVSDSDKCFPAANMYDASNLSEDELNRIGLDAIFVLTGLTEYEKDARLFDIINGVRAKFVLMSDDPRCLISVEKDERLVRIPDKIISQFEGAYMFKGVPMVVEYVPLQTASCYGFNPSDEKCLTKKHPIVVVSNTSGKGYDRVKVLSELIKDVGGIRIYGRLSEEEREVLGKERCMGEVKYKEMQEILSESVATILVPIQKGWVTSKYIEALMNYTMPIFHTDYGTHLLFPHLVTANDRLDLLCLIETIKEDPKLCWEYSYFMMRVLVEPYVDGKRLSRKIIECAGGTKDA